jgi:A/G-specific adenine glycosylase
MDKNNFITKAVLRMYAENKRDLPWRNTHNPYKIWLSEIILQQTQVKQALPYYYKITKAFPTLEDLAKAEENDLLLLWQGLGYYSRARNMHAAARYIQNELQGKFPETYSSLLKLKGVGDYTAAAIASIAFGESVAAVDGNVIRILSRVYAVKEPVDKASGKALIANLAKELVPKDNAGDFNQAVMDLGATVCRKSNPDCLNCPLNTVCEAYAENINHRLPVKANRQKKQNRYMYYFIARNTSDTDRTVILRKRSKQGIWKNMYDFPVLEYGRKQALSTLCNDFTAQFDIPVQPSQIISTGNSRKHLLSHRNLFVKFYLLLLPGDAFNDLSAADENFIRVTFDNLDSFPFPKIINKFFEEEGKSLF